MIEIPIAQNHKVIEMDHDFLVTIMTEVGIDPGFSLFENDFLLSEFRMLIIWQLSCHVPIQHWGGFA